MRAVGVDRRGRRGGLGQRSTTARRRFCATAFCARSRSPARSAERAGKRHAAGPPVYLLAEQAGRLVGARRGVRQGPQLRRVHLRLGLGERRPARRHPLLPQARDRGARDAGDRHAASCSRPSAGPTVATALHRRGARGRRRHRVLVDPLAVLHRRGAARARRRRLLRARRRCSSTGRTAATRRSTTSSAQLKSRKRKQLRKERAKAQAAIERLTWVDGAELDETQLDDLDRFYRTTTDNHGGRDYLRPGFFHALAEDAARRDAHGRGRSRGGKRDRRRAVPRDRRRRSTAATGAPTRTSICCTSRPRTTPASIARSRSSCRCSRRARRASTSCCAASSRARRTRRTGSATRASPRRSRTTASARRRRSALELAEMAKYGPYRTRRRLTIERVGCRAWRTTTHAKASALHDSARSSKYVDGLHAQARRRARARVRCARGHSRDPGRPERRQAALPA